MTFHRAVAETGEGGKPTLTVDPIGDLSPHVLADFEAHPDASLVLHFHGESDLSTKLAFLSWAFLAVFAKFGYAYALAACSRPVRAGLIDRHSTFGDGFFIRYGDLPKRFEEMSVGLAVVMDASPDGGHHARLLGLGVAFDRAAVVCLPVAGDSSGRLIEAFEGEADKDGVVGKRVVVVPFGKLYEGTAGVSFLSSAARFFFREDDGSRLSIIGTTETEAIETLASARAPKVERRSKSAGREIRANWHEDVRLPPAHVNPEDWARTIVDDLRARLEDEAASADVLQAVSELAASQSPAELVESLTSVVDPHLASHARDSYRLFVLGENALDWDDLRLEQAGARLRSLVKAAGHEGASIAFSQALIDPEGDVPVHSLVVVDGDHELIIGGYYSTRSALLAAEVLLASWFAHTG